MEDKEKPIVKPVQFGQSDKTFAVKNGTIIGEENQPAFTIRAAQSNGVLIMENKIKIKSATKDGYEEAEPGDSVNFSVPSSTTRRGRVGKKTAQTLDTACNQGVVIPQDYDPVCVAQRGRNPQNPTSREAGLETEQRLEPRTDGLTNTLTSVTKDNMVAIPKKNYLQWDSSGKGYFSQQDRAFYTRGDSSHITSCRTENKINILDGARIRRLTEIECEKLQGFPPSWTEYGNYDGEVKKVPKTQRYKCLGNAVTVDIVRIIAERLIKYTE